MSLLAKTVMPKEGGTCTPFIGRHFIVINIESRKVHAAADNRETVYVLNMDGEILYAYDEFPRMTTSVLVCCEESEQPKLIVGRRDGYIDVIGIKEKALLYKISPPREIKPGEDFRSGVLSIPRSTKFPEDSSRFIAAYYRTTHGAVWDVSSSGPTLIAELPGFAERKLIHYTSLSMINETHLQVISNEPNAQIWDWSSKKLIATIDPWKFEGYSEEPGKYLCVAGETAFTSHKDGSIRAWNWESGTLQATLVESSPEPTCDKYGDWVKSMFLDSPRNPSHLLVAYRSGHLIVIPLTSENKSYSPTSNEKFSDYLRYLHIGDICNGGYAALVTYGPLQEEKDIWGEAISLWEIGRASQKGGYNGMLLGDACIKIRALKWVDEKRLAIIKLLPGPTADDLVESCCGECNSKDYQRYECLEIWDLGALLQGEEKR